MKRANIYFVTAYESEVENVRCLHGAVYSADWTAEELIRQSKPYVIALCLCFHTNAVLRTFVGRLWGHGICLHPF